VLAVFILTAFLAPLVALCLLPFAVAFGSLLSLDTHGIHAGPTDLLVACLALSYIWRNRTRLLPSVRSVLTRPGQLLEGARASWRRDRARALLFGALLTYLAVIALSVLIAGNKAVAVKEVIKWGEVIAVLALGLAFAHKVTHIRALAWAMIAAGVAEALLGYAQWVLASGDLGPGGASIRVFGTFAQPNPYAGYLNFAVPLALALAVFGRDARERWVAGSASVLLLGAAALANSRGGLLGLIAALLVLAVLGLRRERQAGFALVVGLPLFIIAWATHLIPARLQATLLRALRLDDISLSGPVTNANFSTIERLAHWVAGLRMFRAHPFLGVGAGNYDTFYSRYAELPNWPDPLGHAHNYYINAAAETGILGLVAFLAVVAAMFSVAWQATHLPRLVKALPSQLPTRALALGFFAVIAALTVHNFTDDLFVHAMELQVALCLACLLRLKVQSDAR
jgi:O-antigen ligase